MLSRLVIGTRGSDLALAQSREVAAALEAAWPGLEITFQVMTTRGDRELDQPLPEIGGKGLFTRELEQALRGGKIDLAVHSLKDLPVEDADGLRVGAVTSRPARRDVLYSARGWTLDTLPPRAVVGTSSPRRAAQLAVIRPDARVVSLRGNVPTRIRRVEEGRYDAILLAEAGLARLGLLRSDRCVPLPVDTMIPAPGQGALAVQCRADDANVLALLAPLHDPVAAVETAVERAFLRALGGGCAVPVGAACEADGNRLVLRVFRDRWRVKVEGSMDRPEDLVSAAVEKLREREGGTLSGRRVVITRARDQAGTFREMLEDRGAVVLELPLIGIQLLYCPTPDPDDVSLLVFTSANGPRAFAASLSTGQRFPLEFWQRVPVAVIGPGTGRAAMEQGFRVEITADESVAEAFLETLRDRVARYPRRRVVVVQGEQARDTLCKGLREMGAIVTRLVPYRTCCRSTITETESAMLEAFQPEVVAFTSASTVRAFAGAVPEAFRCRMEAAGVRYVSIGPQTSLAAGSAGLPVARTAERHDLAGLTRALEEMFNPPGECRNP